MQIGCLTEGLMNGIHFFFHHACTANLVLIIPIRGHSMLHARFLDVCIMAFSSRIRCFMTSILTTASWSFSTFNIMTILQISKGI